MTDYFKKQYLNKNSQEHNEKAARLSRSLLYQGGVVTFRLETDLEDFVTDAFSRFLPDLEFLDRQVTIENQRIDILAVEKSSKKAVIIELKNEEDRGIVPQLARYRKALIKNPKFSDRIDYNQSITMIGIAPCFHADNITDKEASKFEEDIILMPYYIQYNDSISYLFLNQKLELISWPIIGLTKLPVHENSVDAYKYLPVETSQFMSRLKSYRQDFLELRNLFLQQPKCKEFIAVNFQSCIYSTNSSNNAKKLAEITTTRKGIFLYLWIPFSFETPQKLQIARCGFLMTDGSSPFRGTSEIDYINYCPKGTIKISEKPDRNSLKFSTRWSPSEKYIERFLGVCGNGLRLLMNLFSMEYREQYFWTENRHLKSSISTQLNWYLDVAIRLWNYRLLGKDFLDIEPKFRDITGY